MVESGLGNVVMQDLTPLVMLMEPLKPTEYLLHGRTASQRDGVERDEVSRRIRWLVQETLSRVCADPSGWDTLYVDKTDGRYWELLYLESEEHGGGPPTLQSLSSAAATEKYLLQTTKGKQPKESG